MIANNLGYLFECRKDANNRLGVMNKHNTLRSENKVTLTITCGVDMQAKIVLPSRLNKSIGFERLDNFIVDVMSLDTFVRSNRTMFSVNGEFSMIGSGTLVYDLETFNLINDKGFYFYVPVTELSEKNNYYLVCERLAINPGIKTFCVNKDMYDAYKSNFLKCITPMFLRDKRDYVASLLHFNGGV